MKTLKYKAYCVIEITDDLRKIPSLHKSRSEAIHDSTSYFGHTCDDPRKRGVVAECEVVVKVPDMPQVTAELREYMQEFHGIPALTEVGNAQWNKHARKLAKDAQRKELKKLRHATKR